MTNEEAIDTLQRHKSAFQGSQLAKAIEHAIMAMMADPEDVVPGSDQPPPVVAAEPPEVKYEYRGLVCEFHDQHAHRRVRHATGPWECCDCAGVET